MRKKCNHIGDPQGYTQCVFVSNNIKSAKKFGCLQENPTGNIIFLFSKHPHHLISVHVSFWKTLHYPVKSEAFI